MSLANYMLKFIITISMISEMVSLQLNLEQVK